MKSLVELLVCLLQECGRQRGAPVQKDIDVLLARSEHEGLSFITITLSNFDRDFCRSLDRGSIGPDLFLSFRKEKTGIPSFLKGFLSNVFGSDGHLLASPSIDCIRAVRQICRFASKLLLPCTEARNQHAIEQYSQCDDDVVDPPEGQLKRYVGIVGRLIFEHCHELREDLEKQLLILRPRHGPGATQERISGNQKWQFRRWHKRLEEVGFTYLRFGRASQPDPTDAWPSIIDPEDEAPARVVLVPKTLKTPRVIAVEPVCMQYAQQALRSVLYRAIENCPLTSGHVEFRRQEVNQNMARQSAVRQLHATLDMKDASDRVSLAHFNLVFESVPVFRRLAQACRSERAQLPNGSIRTLRKFASMGSALCFPVEAIIFYSTIIASRILRAGRFPTAQLVHTLGRDVYVYGDDLVVPADEAPAICADLESFGFKVNRHKSFWTGKFRESCGLDCYDGVNVTPVYVRRLSPTDRRDAADVVSAVATANQLTQAGYPVTATRLRKRVERLLGPLPGLSRDGSVIGWLGSSEFQPRQRTNRDLQHREHYVWTTTSPRDPDPLDGDPALMKCFGLIGLRTESGILPTNPEHLATSPRPYGLSLRRRWVSEIYRF